MIRSILAPVPQATAASTVTQQGMISPVNPFSDPLTGMLLPVSFRFLYGMFAAIGALQQQVGTLEAQVATLNQRAGIT